MRYRAAAMAEFMRSLRTLKALQAEQAATELPVAGARAAHPRRPAARPRLAHRRKPNEPERRPGQDLSFVSSTPCLTDPGLGALHEPAAP